MQRQSSKLRALLRGKTFLHMPSVYDPLGARLVQSLGYEATYVGGYVSGAATAVTEPAHDDRADRSRSTSRSIAIPRWSTAARGFDALHHAHGATTAPASRACTSRTSSTPSARHYHAVHGTGGRVRRKISFACKQRRSRSRLCRHRAHDTAAPWTRRSVHAHQPRGRRAPTGRSRAVRPRPSARRSSAACRSSTCKAAATETGVRFSPARTCSKWDTSPASRRRWCCAPRFISSSGH